MFESGLLFISVVLCICSVAKAQLVPWEFTISTTGLTYPATYVWGTTGAPLTVAFLTAASSNIATDACPNTGDTISCTISNTYPPNIAGKFSITYNPSGGGNFLLDNTAGGCTLTLSASLTCYSDTIAYSGTTQQVVVNMYMTDLTGNCPSASTRYNSIAQPVVLLVDCSGYTSSTSTSTTTTSTSTSTSTSTTTTATTTQTTSTAFIQSPGGIATVVVCPVVGLAILAGIGYGIYKCCVNQASISAAPVTEYKEVAFVTSKTGPRGEELPPAVTKYYSNPTYQETQATYYNGTPVSRFGESASNATTMFM